MSEWINIFNTMKYEYCLSVYHSSVDVWRRWGRCGCGLWAAHSFSLAAPLQSVSRCGGERTERSGAPGPGICTTLTAARPQPNDRQAGAERAEQHGSVRAAGRPGPAPQKSLFDLFIYRVCELFFPQHGDYRLLAATGCTLHPHLPTR